MGQDFKETAHFKTDLKAYRENYDHIFKKYKCNCHLFDNQTCDTCKEDEEMKDRVIAEDFGPCDF